MYGARADGWSVRRWLLLGTAALVVLHLVLSARTTGPWVLPDEAGYLGNARWFSGDRNWPMDYSPFYSSGYSLLVAPITVVARDPHLQWRLTVALNALLLASVFPLLFLTLRRVLAVAPRRALVAAGLGAIAPAALAAGYSGVSENLVLPLLLASVLAAWVMADSGRPLRARVWLGPAAAGLYFAHPRFTLVVPVAFGVLVLAAVMRRIPRTVAGWNLAGLVIATLAARAVNEWIQSARWASVERPEGGLQEVRELLTSSEGLRELFTTATGQVWYLIAGSFGLVLIGVLLAVVRVARPSPLDELQPVDPDSQQVALLYVVLTAAAVFTTSTLFFAQNQTRLDHYIYGRHNDSFTPLWVGLAVAYLISDRRLATRLRSLALTAVPIAVTGAIVVRERDPLAFESRVSTFSVPAIVEVLTIDKVNSFRLVTFVALAGVAIGVALLALEAVPTTRVRPGVVARACFAVGLGLWFLNAGWDGSTSAAGFDRIQYEDWHTPDDIARLGIDRLSIDGTAAGSRASLTYPYFLPDVQFEPFNGAEDDPPGPYSVALSDDQRRIDAGDRILLLDQGYTYEIKDAPQGVAVWVAPGPEQDRLEAKGWLLPEGFPTELPASAQQARVDIGDRAGDTISVPSGERIPLDVKVSHLGSGSPWPDSNSYAKDGRVRVMADITPLDPDGMPGARSGGELTSWMLPGDRGRVDAEILAVDTMLSPLPPGRYQVQLGVGQEGEDWFVPGGPDAAFTMVVTPPR